MGYLKIFEFAEEFTKFTPGIRRARAPGPGPWALGTGGDSVPVGTHPTNSQTSYEFTEIL